MTCTTTCRPVRGRLAHCGACHRSFSGVTAFDRHRVGGECIDPEKRGMHLDASGLWREAGGVRFWDAVPPGRGDAVSDEQAGGVPRYTPGDSEPADSLSGSSA